MSWIGWTLATITAAMFAAWALSLLLRHRPAYQDLVWRTTLLVVAIIPVLLIGRGYSRDWQLCLPLLPAISDNPTSPVKLDMPTAMQTTQSQAVASPSDDATNNRPIHKSVAQENTPQAAKTFRDEGTTRYPATHFSWFHALTAIWLVGLMLQCIRIVRGLWNAYQLTASASPVEPTVRNLVRSAAKRTGLRRPPILLVSDHVDGPVVVGLLRSVILVPSSLLTPSRRVQLRLALLHECGHIRRYDLAYELILQGVTACYWFHPLVWLMASNLRRLREEICDNYVLAEESPITYAETLLEMAVQQRLAQGSFAGLSMFSGQRLAERVDALLAGNRPGETRPKGWIRYLVLVAASVMMMSVLILQWERATAAEPEVTDTAATQSVPDTVPTLERRSFEFRVLNSKGDPVSGAQVTAVGCAFRFGSPCYFSDESAHAVAKTDANGMVRIVFTEQMETAARYWFHQAGELTAVRLRIEHPDHPVWTEHANIEADRPIVLADSAKIAVRAHHGDASKPVGRLFPLIPGVQVDWQWSEQDHELTIRRLDLSSKDAGRLLRIVHVPEQGPAWFSPVVDLRKFSSHSISLDLALHPGVRVTGRLAEDVPRPITNGYVLGMVLSGPGTSHTESVRISTVAKVASDGTFHFDSLPANEHLQLFASCDGWTSRSLTGEELKAYQDQHGFVVHYPEMTTFEPSHGQLPRLLHLSGDHVQTVIPMNQAAKLAVTVTDQEGNPLADVEVQVPDDNILFNGYSGLGRGFDLFAHIRHRLASPEDEAVGVGALEDRTVARTDAEGKAVIVNIPVTGPRQSQSVLLSSKEYVAVPNAQYPVGTPEELRNLVPLIMAQLEPGRTTHIDVKMRPHDWAREMAGPGSEPRGDSDTPMAPLRRLEIGGRVTDLEGNPIEGVRVRFGNADEFEILTDKSGRYRRFFAEFEGEDPGDDPYPVCFLKEGYAPTFATCRFGVSTTVTMAANTYFEGVVYNSEGQPAADVLVRAHCEIFADSGMQFNLATETRSDARGRYKLLVQPGTFVLNATDDQMGTAWLPKRDADDHRGPNNRGDLQPSITLMPNQVEQLDIRLQTGVILKVRVLDAATKQPVPSALLSVGEYREDAVPTDEAGRATLPLLPPGKCTLQIFADGYTRARSDQASPRWRQIAREQGVTATRVRNGGVIFELKPEMEEVTVYLER